jgi:hypothetical protein
MIKLDKYWEVKDWKLYITKEQSFDLISKVIRQMWKPSGFREKTDDYYCKVNWVKVYIVDNKDD